MKQTSNKDTYSLFTMQHSKDVLNMSVDEAKVMLHNIVDTASATDANKANIKKSINTCTTIKQLSYMIANHVLAAGGGGHKTGDLRVLR